jgi:enterochelin esterase-like enzyme
MHKLVFLSLSITLAFAQQKPFIQSPDVQSDGRVTFRLLAPEAHNVSVRVEGTEDALSMHKDGQGIWSVTTNALAPDLYGYFFEVDGVHLVDPVNSEIKPNLLSLSNVVDVAGATPLAWELTDIPHGALHHHFYKSNIIGDNRDFYVYTPPGYDGNAQQVYPVLYLLHGFSDDASGWSSVGKANLILDSLIAEKKAKPMLVVMPLGYGAPEIVQRNPEPGSAFKKNSPLRDRNFNNFRAALIDEVIPAVERTYKVDANRNARAIAGLSMGGAESLLTGLNRLDKFAWVGAFSAGGASEDRAADFPQVGAETNQQLNLLWIACGTEDRLITPNRETIAWLKSKGVAVTAVEAPGMHTWMVWRRNLMTFAPLLFQHAPVRATIITGEN